MRKEVKNDVTVKRVIKISRDRNEDIATVELNTGQIATVKWDIVNNWPLDRNFTVNLMDQKVGPNAYPSPGRPGGSFKR